VDDNGTKKKKSFAKKLFDICGTENTWLLFPSCCGNLPALDESGMKKRRDLDE